ncbi:MAG TPA: choice-of-anchor Q domain-containing protein [Solirubrobacterales bacterium]|nr:choice-of-anchor Q domain-containing protein [Solirubrobacterales bacterium]
MRLIPVACALVALALFAPAASQAATFTVNTTGDTSVGGGCTTDPACSLRDAVNAAGLSTDLEDLVVVPAGTYSISAGELSVSGEGTVAVRGAGARSTVIDAHQTSRVFNLSADKSVLEGLTVTGGLTEVMGGGEVPGDGGGVLAYEGGEAVLQGLNVTGNVAGQNGGGVSAPPEGTNRTAVTIAGSTISGNRVTGGALEALGGGVYVLGKLSMTNSTVTGNSVESSAVSPIVQGGGVLLAIDPTGTEPSEATIVNSTIAGNSLGTGGVAGGGLGAVNPTMTPGGSAALTVKNTIVAGNTVPAGPSDCAVAATVTSDHNLSGDASCMFGDGGSKQNTNPLLGALANNGGETDTLALQAGSPAIDAGTNDGCPATDQRGVSRPQGSACDVGAFELVPAPPAAASADLRLKIKPKPKRPTVGGKLAFLITVRNAGPSAASGTIVKGTVPALATKAAAPKLNGKPACKLAKAKKGKRKLTCRLGEIAAGKAKKVRVKVKTAKPTKVRLRARVRSGVSDPNPKNNKAKAGAQIRD